MIEITSKGDFNKLTTWLNKSSKPIDKNVLEKYGQLGVEALQLNTPVDTGLTAESWTYNVSVDHGRATLSFDNTNENKGIKIAILLQYGHGTRNGGWVEGRDYINPALQPIFDSLAQEAWEEAIKV